jgi:hypothetical protein
VCVIALSLAALTLLLASLGVAASPSAGSARTALEARAVVVRQYWTAERMREAKPLTALPGPLGTEVRAAPKRRRHQHKVKAKPLAHYSKGANRAHGKVFFHLTDGDYVCSGTSLRSGSRSVVWTAGHCVFDERALGGYATRWEFVPAYHRAGGHDKAPFGEWPAEALATTRQWQGGIGGLDGGDRAFDFGIATVAQAPGGATLQSTVGGRKIAFHDKPRHSKTLRAIGYPAARPFTGTEELSCTSKIRGRDRRIGPPDPIAISCNMTGGASGGGWIDKQGRLVSVTSYGYTGLPGTLFGPYQGQVAERLFYENGGA